MTEPGARRQSFARRRRIQQAAEQIRLETAKLTDLYSLKDLPAANSAPDEAAPETSLSLSELSLRLQINAFHAARERILAVIHDCETELSGPDTGPETLEDLNITRQMQLQLLAHTESELRVREELLQQIRTARSAADPGHSSVKEPLT